MAQAHAKDEASPSSAPPCPLQPVLELIDNWAAQVAGAKRLAHRYERAIQAELSPEIRKDSSISAVRQRLAERKSMAAELRALVAAALASADVSAKDRAFYTGKIAAARFFATTMLPRISAERAVAEATDNAPQAKSRISRSKIAETACGGTFSNSAVSAINWP